MTRLALVITLVTGCFYVDPINQRPSIAIVAASSDPVFRGSTVQLHSEAVDPDGSSPEVDVTWHAYLCTDATDPSTCDIDPAFYSSTNADALFIVPILRADGVTQVTSVLVQLEAVDEGGAPARPSQQLVIPVGDHPPDLELRKVARNGYVVGTAIDMFAKYGDPDDPLDASCFDAQPRPCVTVDWQVVTPQVDSTFSFVDLAPDLTDPLHPVVGKTLTPGPATEDIGEWMVQVTATDPEGVPTVELITIDVVQDHPPCLAQLQPIVPPLGISLPVSQPTLFSVPVVIDDLDVWPPNPADPILGTTTFSWSLKPPGSTTRQPFGTGASVDFDPSAFAPGDIVELRVEIKDRQNTAIACTDSDPTCSVISDPACLQRQTWQVEVQ